MSGYCLAGVVRNMFQSSHDQIPSGKVYCEVDGRTRFGLSVGHPQNLGRKKSNLCVSRSTPGTSCRTTTSSASCEFGFHLAAYVKLLDDRTMGPQKGPWHSQTRHCWNQIPIYFAQKVHTKYTNGPPTSRCGRRLKLERVFLGAASRVSGRSAGAALLYKQLPNGNTY